LVFQQIIGRSLATAGADTGPEKMDIKPLALTVAEALKATGLGRTKFYELVNEGRIKTISLGRRRLVVYASLEALVSSEVA
jgi:excisionase family DNA binding protein